jgi:hypothetical protein
MIPAHFRLKITRVWNGRRFVPAVYDAVAYDAAGGSRHLGPFINDPAVLFIAATEAECDRYIDAVRDGTPFAPAVETPHTAPMTLQADRAGQLTWLEPAP